MNRDDIIRMAREADINLSTIEYYQRELEHFAALVAAAERKEILRWEGGDGNVPADAIRAKGQPL